MIKKKFQLAIFLILFLFPMVSAIQINMDDNFSQGETLTAKVSGNFFEAISEQNVAFYRGHIRTSIIPFVSKINNEFYIYAQLLDKSPNNYSLVIENAKYYQGSKIIEKDIVKNFSINKNIADFSVDKGFVITKGDFFIEVKNLQDYEITINLKTSNKSTNNKSFFSSLFGSSVESGSSIILNPEEIKKINFKVNDFNDSSEIELSTDNLKYEIPVYVFSKQEKQKQKIFRFEPSEINFSLVINSNKTGIIHLRNIGETEIENISLIISDSLLPYISLSINKIDKLDKNSSKKIEFNISSDTEEKSIEGQITAKTSDNKLHTYTSVFLNFLRDYIPPKNKENSVVSQTCSELDGTVCNQNQKCNEDNINYAKDGICCLGTCQTEKKSSSGKIIGWLLIVGIIGFGLWFYLKKYKKVESVNDLMRILKR